MDWGPANSELDVVEPSAVKHLQKPMTECLNFITDPVSKLHAYHKFELKREVTKHGLYIMVDERCRTCDLQYSREVIPKTRVDLLEKKLTEDERKQLDIEPPP